MFCKFYKQIFIFDAMCVCKYFIQVICFVFTLSLNNNCCVGQFSMRKDVELQFIVPFHASAENRFRSTHLEAKDTIKYGYEVEYKRLRQHFAINSWLNFTDTQTPDEILGIFCKEIFTKSVNTIVNLNYGVGTTSSNNYIMQLASHLGYPVISWDPHYPGALQVRLSVCLCFK
mgnify:FL=1